MSNTATKLQITTTEAPVATSDVAATVLLRWPADTELKVTDLGFVIEAMGKRGYYLSCVPVHSSKFSAMWFDRRDNMHVTGSTADASSFHEAVFAATRNVLNAASATKKAA